MFFANAQIIPADNNFKKLLKLKVRFFFRVTHTILIFAKIWIFVKGIDLGKSVSQFPNFPYQIQSS